MKNVLFTSALLIAFLSTLSAQQSAPFEFKDEKAIPIDNIILEKLVDKYWSSYKQYTIQGKESDEYTYDAISFILKKDHIFQSTNGTTGIWEVQKKKVLHIKTTSEHGVNQEKTMGGNYVIYNISNDHLVLVKNITSNLDAKIVFYFKVSEVVNLAARPVTASVKTSLTKEELEVKWAAAEEKLEQMDDEKLELEVMIEFFIRSMEMPDNIEEMKREELISLYKKVIRGEYKG